MSLTSDFSFWPSVQGQHFSGSGHTHSGNQNVAVPGQKEQYMFGPSVFPNYPPDNLLVVILCRALV